MDVQEMSNERLIDEVFNTLHYLHVAKTQKANEKFAGIYKNLSAELLRRMDSPIVKAMKEHAITLVNDMNNKSMTYCEDEWWVEDENHGQPIESETFITEQAAIDALLG